MTTATPAATTTTTPAAAGGPPSTSAALAASAAPSAPAAASPAAGGAPGAASTPTTETVNPGAWMAGFDDDTKGWIQNKQYKNPADLAAAHRSLEKLLGAPKERLMTLPESFYDEKGALTPAGRDIFERLGAPKEAKDYGIEMPKEGGDAKRLETFLATAKDLGLTKAQAQKLAAMDDAYIGSVKASAQVAATQRHNDDVVALKGEWGAAYESNRQLAGEGMRRVGLTDAQVNGLSAQIGHKETMKLLSNLGKSVSESAFVGGTAPTRPLEPAGAKAKIQELMGDRDFGERLMRGESEAKATWERLHQQATPGTLNI